MLNFSLLLQTLNYNLSATDPDNDPLTFDATIDGNGSVSVVGNSLAITPDLDFNGAIQVEVTVSDGEFDDSDTFILTVNPINDAPVSFDVNNGTIDVIVSDHKPQDEESKRLTFAQAATGASGVETLLPLALELFHNKSVELKRLIASITSNPAKILDINKGNLDKGNDADLCVFDINKPWVVDKSKLKSKSKNTPIENRKLQGQVLKTFVKGELAYEV